jgi:hypothetical protein
MLGESNKYKYMDKPMLGKHFRIIFEEMSKRVGVKFEEVNPWREGWYLKHTWTEAEQRDFRDWLVKYFQKNSQARDELMKYKSTNKQRIEKVANEIIFNYGWKVK